MFNITWPVATILLGGAFILVVLLICVANVTNTSIVSSTLKDLPVEKAKYYPAILESTTKGLPSVGLNVKTEVTHETKTK